MELVDIGANLGKCSAPDLAAQLVRATAAGVSHILLTGCSVRGSQEARRLCEEWSGQAGLQRAKNHLGAAALREIQEAGLSALPALAFTAGVHPHDAKSCDDQTLITLRSLALHEQCVAVGECGLDYDRMFSPREVQLHWCRQQLALAVELDMPVFLHERDRDAQKGAPFGSARELLAMLQELKLRPERVCIHCFTGSRDILEAYVARGYFVGLTGFAGMQKRGAHLRAMLAAGCLPLLQLMVETDCPFMLPDAVFVPQDLGVEGRRNEPCVMPGVCRAVAESLGVSAAEVARATTENAKRFFRL